MNPRTKLALAAKELIPLRQGDLDGFCGLYAIINAVRLAIHPGQRLRHPQSKRLFEAGIVTLGRHRRLRYALKDGMTDATWRQVCEAVLAEADHLVAGRVTATWIFAGEARLEVRDMVRCVRRSVRDGNPVLITLGGCYHHWTVVVGFNGERLRLFDSASYRWVLIRSIGSATDHPLRRHQISPAGVIALSFHAGPPT